MRISAQIFPRCVVLIATVDSNGKPNVMTASFVMPVSFNPKYVAIAIAPSRHTLHNLKEVPEFTLNLASKDMKEKAEICGSYSGKEKDKFKLASLDIEKSELVRPPLLKEAPISFECKVEEMKEFGDHFIVVGKVLREHVRKKEFEPLLHKSGEVYMEAKELVT